MHHASDIARPTVAIGGRLACVSTGFSPDSAASVRDIVLPTWPSVSWHDAELDNPEHRLIVTGTDHEKRIYRMVVGDMGCGYTGTGVHAAAEVLELLGFGEKNILFAAISQPTTTPNWRSQHHLAVGEIVE